MLGTELSADDYIRRLKTELDNIDREQIENWAQLVFDCYEKDHFVFILGNGGSGNNASHMCEDLGKSSLPESDLFDESKKRLRVMSLTDNIGWIMAIANDLSYDQIFVQQLMNFGREGDLVIAISGSGNSPNVLKAVDWANRHGLVTLGLTGYDGGQLNSMCRHQVHVPLDDMGMVESIHLSLYHWMLNDVHARINRLGRYQQD